MPLNVKNEFAHDLARQLSDLTGATITDAVTTALSEALARERARHETERRRMVSDLDRLAEQCAALPVVDDRPAEEILGYDEKGVPT